MICLIFGAGAYNRYQTEYFMNTLACIELELELKQQVLEQGRAAVGQDWFLNQILSFYSIASPVPKSSMMFTTAGETLETSCLRTGQWCVGRS